MAVELLEIKDLMHLQPENRRKIKMEFLKTISND
jgi:hypothetical protein